MAQDVKWHKYTKINSNIEKEYFCNIDLLLVSLSIKKINEVSYLFCISFNHKYIFCII